MGIDTRWDCVFVHYISLDRSNFPLNRLDHDSLIHTEEALVHRQIH